MPNRHREPGGPLAETRWPTRCWQDICVAGLFLAGSGCFLAATLVEVRTLFLPSLGIALFITGGATYIRSRYQEPLAPGGLTPVTVFLMVSSWLAVVDAVGHLDWWLLGGVFAAVLSRAITSFRTRRLRRNHEAAIVRANR